MAVTNTTKSEIHGWDCKKINSKKQEKEWCNSALLEKLKINQALSRTCQSRKITSVCVICRLNSKRGISQKLTIHTGENDAVITLFTTVLYSNQSFNRDRKRQICTRLLSLVNWALLYSRTCVKLCTGPRHYGLLRRTTYIARLSPSKFQNARRTKVKI